MAIGWDSPETARLYEEFSRRHGRYRDANAALAEHAELEGARRVLDVGAGTGGTAEAALRRLGPGASVLCVEPAAAMRELGEARLRDGRVAWTDELPRHGAYDRVLCGAGIWQLGPLGPTIVRLASLVAPGGALCFSVPALYLGEPDDPGGGRDPLLLELPALVANGRTPQADPAEPLPAPDGVEALLAGAGLRPVRYALRRRVTQGELRDWLKIPVLTDALLPGADPDERGRTIDAAYRRADPASWRWERWLGWTAWK